MLPYNGSRKISARYLRTSLRIDPSFAIPKGRTRIKIVTDYCSLAIKKNYISLCYITVKHPSNPMDCSLPGSSIHGIFQARVLEWGAISFSDQYSILTHIYGI